MILFTCSTELQFDLLFYYLLLLLTFFCPLYDGPCHSVQATLNELVEQLKRTWSLTGLPRMNTIYQKPTGSKLFLVTLLSNCVLVILQDVYEFQAIKKSLYIYLEEVKTSGISP